jgi:hypothetical protein
VFSAAEFESHRRIDVKTVNRCENCSRIVWFYIELPLAVVGALNLKIDP